MQLEQVMVTVCCLTYNHEKYIKDALDGFVSQKTDFKYEVIVHDDASTDRTAEIIKEYAERFPEIIKPIFQTENQFSKQTKCMDAFVMPAACGKYIACCEGDDYWTSCKKLQTQVDFLENHPEYVACAHNSEVLKMRDMSWELRNKATKDYDCTLDELLSRMVNGKLYIWQTSGIMYRRSCLAERPDFFTAMKTFGDLPLDLYLLTYGKVRFFAEPMSVYRVGTETSLKRQADSSHKKMAGEVVSLLKSFDEYTGYEYTAKLHILIIRHLYQKYFEEGQFEKLREGELGEIFYSKPLSYRIKFRIRCNSPRLYRCLFFLKNVLKKGGKIG